MIDQRNTILSIYRQQPLLMIGLTLLLIGLPLSLFLTSLSQFFLAGSFFLEGSVKEKWKRFLASGLATYVVLFWLYHVIGLAWTTDLHEGIKDIRIKLPLLALPLILAGSGPLQQQQFRYLLSIFAAAVLTGTLVHSAVLIGWIPYEVRDVRDIFIFKISHIRFSLFVCFAFVICYWLGRNANWLQRIVLLMVGCWLTAFLVFTASATGLFILGLLLFTFLVFKVLPKLHVAVKLSIIVALLAGAYYAGKEITSTYQSMQVINDYPGKFSHFSAEGNYYYSDSSKTEYENGYRVWVYISDPELQREWEKVSSISYDSSDLKGQPLRGTLIRYMSSKGLRKDAYGFRQLSAGDIHAIEQGIGNYSYVNMSGVERRFRETLWELDKYERNGDANGHSLAQRLEYWKTARYIIRHNAWMGVGTGDMNLEFRRAYIETNSSLLPQYRLRSHNQFLSATVALGFIGLIIFLLVIVAPITSTHPNRDLLFVGFWIIAIVSMFTEDTLETQPGATFFALFIAFLLYSRVPEKTS